MPSVLRAGFLVIAVAAFGSSIGSASSDGFHNGDAQASADTFSLNLKAANATIGFTWGRSLAAYQDRTATSEGRALDLGVLPVLFSGVQCDGSPGILNADTLPPVSNADSSEPGSNASRRAQAFQPGIDGGPIGPSVGFQDATATALPSSRAITESAPADLGIIALDGGRTEVTTQLADQVRQRATGFGEQVGDQHEGDHAAVAVGEVAEVVVRAHLTAVDGVVLSHHLLDERVAALRVRRWWRWLGPLATMRYRPSRR